MTYHLEPTRTTPHVRVDSEIGEVTISGRSSPENSISFYAPILEAIDKINHPQKLVLNFAFEYFNTSSSKCLYDLMRKARGLTEQGREVIINWFYDPDDDDMLEAGEDYEDLLQLSFNYHHLN